MTEKQKKITATFLSKQMNQLKAEGEHKRIGRLYLSQPAHIGVAKQVIIAIAEAMWEEE